MVAVDADQGPVELLYRDLKQEGNEQILTLTMNLADPSPGLGWRGLERKSLPERGKPDLVLALALVHHVAISANVPVKEFIDWLASLGSCARDRVPHARGPDGQEAARAQARRAAPRLRARATSSAPSTRRSRSSAPSASSRARACCTSPARSGDDKPQRRRATGRELLWAYLGLAVLWTFAVAQPLFDLLKDNPEFFAARGSSGFDVISFSVLLVVLPPALLLAIELLVGLAGRRAPGASLTWC